MVDAAARLPPSPERDIPLRGLALAILLHAAVALAWAASWQAPEEVPVVEVNFVLPEPVPATPAVPDPAPPETAAAASAPPPPVSQPAPEPPAATPPAAAALPVPSEPEAPQPPADPPPRPAAKPARPARPVPALQAADDPPPPAAVSPTTAPPVSLPVPATPAPADTAAAPVAPAPAQPAIPPLQAYALQLRNLLAAQRAYPQAARQRRQEGVVSIALTIDRAGQLAGVRLYEASAFPLLDEAALAMARRAAPFPPPPLEPHQRQAVFVVPVGFALQE